MLTKIRSFTAKHNGIVNVLITETFISQPFDPASQKEHPPVKKYHAIWDTGATNSVITRKVIDECGLKPIGMTRVHHCGGTSDREIYLVNIILRNNVGVSHVRVTEAELQGADVLIGMDIISQGDFAITNKDGKTTFSFRMPSIECIDFNEQKPSTSSQPQILEFPHKPNRNAPCPCGSGKKYKKCHGK